MEQFQRDMLTSVRQMKGGKAARVTEVKLSAAAEARAKVGVSQNAFAQLLGVSLRTLQDWEQGVGNLLVRRRRYFGLRVSILRR